MFIEPNVRSSYGKNNIGIYLYNLVVQYKPARVVDFGLHKGYSSMCFLQALRDIGGEELTCLDKFSDPHFKDVHTNLMSYGVDSVSINMKCVGFEDWICVTKPPNFDFIHLDIDNTGNDIRLLYDHLKPWIDDKSIIAIFEGGSSERDGVRWMYQNKNVPIQKSGVPYTLITGKFPSLSIINPIS